MMHSARPVPNEKRCIKCNECKPLSDFNNMKAGKYGKHSYCRPCTKTANKAWRDAPANKVKRHGYHIASRYGISKTEYDSKFKDQGGKCAICNEEQSEKRLAVDHCHRTGKVRSLLCDNCNKAIGLLNDDPHRILSALNYVKLFESDVPEENLDTRCC